MRPYVVTYVALLVLLGLTMTVAVVPLGAFNPILNLAIAVAKAALILWMFMHLREMPPLVRVMALGALFWLAILFSIGTADWLTRY